MGISTQTTALLDLYNQKISLDNTQLTQLNYVQSGYTITTGIGTTDYIKVWGPSEVVENYNPIIQKIDAKIVEINDQIINLQQEISILGQQANAVGCGTTGVGIGVTVIVYEDQLRYRGYTWTAPNPFSPIGGTLISSNTGIGTEDYISQIGIGSYFDPIGTCYNLLTCSSGICAGYATSVTNLKNQIIVLQNDRDPLISKVNFLKGTGGRSQYQLQNYGMEQSKAQVNASIGVSSSIISFLEDPANAEWL